MKELTRDDVIALINDIIDKEGNQARAALRLGVSPGFLANILNGRKEPGTAILDYFGLEKVVRYIYTRK